MKITWRTVTGTQEEMPLEVDKTSSPDTVYLRKNVKKTTIELGENSIEGYTYEEAQLTLDEYEQYQKEQDEMQSEAFKAQQENTEIIMTAIADLYELLATN